MAMGECAGGGAGVAPPLSSIVSFGTNPIGNTTCKTRASFTSHVCMETLYVRRSDLRLQRRTQLIALPLNLLPRRRVQLHVLPRRKSRGKRDGVAWYGSCCWPLHAR